jgi:hypothetical protein
MRTVGTRQNLGASVRAAEEKAKRFWYKVRHAEREGQRGTHPPAPSKRDPNNPKGSARSSKSTRVKSTRAPSTRVSLCRALTTREIWRAREIISLENGTKKQIGSKLFTHTTQSKKCIIFRLVQPPFLSTQKVWPVTRHNDSCLHVGRDPCITKPATQARADLKYHNKQG